MPQGGQTTVTKGARDRTLAKLPLLVLYYYYYYYCHNHYYTFTTTTILLELPVLLLLLYSNREINSFYFVCKGSEANPAHPM